MHLNSNRLYVHEDDSQLESFVFLLHENAMTRLSEITKRYIALGWEVLPNSSPHHVKLTKGTRTASIHLHTTPFDDGKRFYARELTIYDLT